MSSPTTPEQEAKFQEKLYDLAVLLQVPSEIPPGLPRVRHEFEGIWPDGKNWLVRGWAASHEAVWTTAELYLDGKKMGRVEPWMRDDLMTHNAHVANIATAGYKFSVDAKDIQANQTIRADLVLYNGDKPIAWMWSPLRTDITEIVPYPPAHLMKRVIGTDNANYFLRFALTCFGQYMGAAARHKDVCTIKSMLDWGCGCGRVSAHYLRIVDGPSVSGCDIDAEDIEWCKQNLTDGRFEATSPFVPLPFKDGEFDLIVSLSVMTHLTREQQGKWLKEIERILAPGGLFVCSVHGFPAARAMPETFVYERLVKEGFIDEFQDPVLDGIAPAGYYRATYQSPEYTKKSFGKAFDVLELVESGVGIQDLVIASKPSKKKGLFSSLKS